jgi:hypothetical protein
VRERLIGVVGFAAVLLLAAGCGGSKTPATTRTTVRPDALAFSQCMRRHGIADFPDPGSNGVIDVKALHPSPSSDLDPSSSSFQAADKACKALAPSTFSPGVSAVSAEQLRRNRTRALAFSACMRAHGMPNFPDPDSNGRLSVGAIRAAGLGPASAPFRSGIKSCSADLPSNIHIAG